MQLSQSATKDEVPLKPGQGDSQLVDWKKEWDSLALLGLWHKNLNIDRGAVQCLTNNIETCNPAPCAGEPQTEILG